MSIIAPTILSSDPKDYRACVERINPFAKRVQIDITDGNFTEQRTLPVISTWWPKEWTVDLHMMVTHPSQHLPDLLKVHPSLVILHAEAEEDLLPIFDQLKQADIKVGVALLKETFPGSVTPVIEAADHVLIFAGALGQQGGDADLLQYEKAPLIRKINPNVEIGWDGGANLSNIREIAHSDIDVINVGAALSQADDPADMYKQLAEEADRKGVRL